MDDDEIMKQINARAGGGGDLDDELADLEAEIEKEEGKKQDSDDELAALENEGVDNLSDEEEKPKPEKKPESKPVPTQPKKQPAPKPQPQPQLQPQPKPQKQPEPPKAKPAPKSAAKANDLYPERVENKYHVPNKMNSLGVLLKEKELCDKIIAYKKQNGIEFDVWEDKKESIQVQYDLIMGFIQNQTWDFEVYKKKLKEQYAWEVKILKFSDMDKSLNTDQKNTLKARINDRLKIIEDELTRNPDEEAEKESQQQKKETPKASTQTTTTKKQTPATTTKKQPPATTAPAKEDDFPEKVEKLYHNIGKMESIGVLNDEKELCDKIIEYKKKIDKDYDDWEFKKENIDDKVQILTSQVNDGILDLAGYKRKIQEQYKYETKLLQFVEKDKNITQKQKSIIISRLNKRKKLIEEELAQNPEEEEGGGEEEPKEEETPQSQQAKEVKPKPELMTQKSLSPLFDVPKDKEQEEIKRLTDVVTERLTEYRNAIDYFKTNEFPEQAKIAIAKAKQICIELKKIQEGKWKEVNEFKLPDPVTPEFIYGYSKDERDKKFAKVVLGVTKQKDSIQGDMNKLMEYMKTIPKRLQKTEYPKCKNELDELKEKRTKLEKQIALLREKFQDKWVPVPLSIEGEEDVSIEKVNEDVPDSTLRVIFGKTKYAKKDRLYLIVKVSDYNLENRFDQKGAGDWTNTIDFKVNESFSRLYQAKLEVEIWEKKLFKDRFKGRFEVRLSPLKAQNAFESPEVKIELDSKREGVTCYVGCKVRKSLKEKEYTTIKKPSFQVTKIYAPFSIRGNNKTEAIKLDVQTTKVTTDDLKINNSTSSVPVNRNTPGQKKNKAPAKAQPKPSQGAPTKKPGGGASKIQVDKSEFSEEELKDPDNINSLKTLMVLEFKQKKYEDISKKIDGRTPRELMTRIIKIKCKRTQLTDALGEDIGPEDYLQLLRNTFEHDKKLATYFNQQKDGEKSKLVSERLPLLFKEMEELMKQMPGK